MNILVISYSFTGNNEVLAKSIAEKISAKHISISEPKTRSIGKIVLDIIFNRTPQVQPFLEDLNNYDLIFFIGPIWMGQVATPLRAYLRKIKEVNVPYAFISISGGPNPKIADELEKRVGRNPSAVLDFPISDLLKSKPRPTRKEVSAYRMDSVTINSLSDKALESLRGLIRNT